MKKNNIFISIVFFCSLCVFSLIPRYVFSGFHIDAPPTSDRVDFGKGSWIDNLAQGTQMVWVYVTDDPPQNRIIYKHTYSSSGWRVWMRADNVLYFQISRDKDTNNLKIKSEANWVKKKDRWEFWAVVWDVNGSNSDQKLYRGLLNSPASEPSTYQSQIVGTGRQDDDSSANLYVGNNNLLTGGFGGSIAWVAIWNRTMTQDEIRDQQFHPNVTDGCILFSHFGVDGTGKAVDLSGNEHHGIPTGVTISNHVPLSLP